jgi:hypothetical protein
MNLDVLKRCCERMPRMIELGAPPHIMLSELRLLMDHAFDAIEELMRTDTREQGAIRRKLSRIANEEACGTTPTDTDGSRIGSAI